MTNEEAKFILSAYRPNGSDSGDAAFGEALRMASGDPALGDWFGRSRAHDAAVAQKLRQIAPPSGLREAILAGARVSGRETRSGPGWGWIAGLAAAAMVAIGVFTMRAPVRPQADAADFAGFAINDMVSAKHGSRGEASGALIARLQTEGAKMPSGADIDFDRMRDTGCRTLSFKGRQVLEVCFVRDGSLFHFYMMRGVSSPGGAAAPGPSFVTLAAGAAAVWSDGRYDYAVASTAGVEAIRRLL